MILEEGQKILIVHRRLFESDAVRFFVGIVDGYEGGIVKVSGHSWFKDQFRGTLVERGDRKTKIFALASGTLMAYVLPDSANLDRTCFEIEGDGSLWLTDGEDLRMNLSEREYHHGPKAPS